MRYCQEILLMSVDNIQYSAIADKNKTFAHYPNV